MDAQSLPSSSSKKEVEESEVDSTQYESSNVYHGLCAICLDQIPLEQTAMIKDCEHTYCVMCILRWATYKENPVCPQCKHPFKFLNIHISLDGCIHDYMFEESVCLLLRTRWFVPIEMENECIVDDFEHDEEIPVRSNKYFDEDDDDDIEESFFMGNLSSIRIGNRRWGNNGFVRAGRKEARPINKQKSIQRLDGGHAGPSRPAKVEAPSDITGRRAKRALKREAADKANMTKHQELLRKLGLK
ncbi:E3 ubiquitin-protein ligase ICP0 [Zostera marina]|uniref:E3 ubiquitin-protein ligase ICP0 n=1 Tax=Zostera marina TaxID=29655 RepID=A0A0K9PPE0_ZOSMR|nr:E3 ubiquitin-protein ligase ICP0 [Zostera marina]